MDTTARHPAGGKMQAVAELGATLLGCCFSCMPAPAAHARRKSVFSGLLDLWLEK